MINFIIGFGAGILFVKYNKYLAKQFEEMCKYFKEKL